MKNKDIKIEGSVLTMEKMDNRKLNSVGSSRIRARWLLNYWPECEEYKIGKKYSFLIFQKVYWGSMMENFEGIKILDLCDPDWLEGQPVFKFIDMCDAVTTSTQALADYIKKLRPKAFVEFVPDRIYIPDHKPIKTVHKGRLRKVCWFGYHHNTHYLLPTFDELIKREIELTVIATAAYTPPLSFRGNLRLNNASWDYETLFKEVVKHDAVLMPKPRGDEKGKYKSNNKITQSWAQGMPVVQTPEDLDKFMKPKARAEESVKRLKEIKDVWDCRFSVDQMREIIKKIKEKK
jgi:hypothetical protein